MFELDHATAIKINTLFALIVICTLFIIGLLRWRLLNNQLLAVEHDAKLRLEQQVHQRTAQLRAARLANRSQSIRRIKLAACCAASSIRSFWLRPDAFNG